MTSLDIIEQHLNFQIGNKRLMNGKKLLGILLPTQLTLKAGLAKKRALELSVETS